MSENLRNYVKAVYSFDHVLKSAPDAVYSRTAPCSGWTGKDVYEHALGNLKMVQSFATTGQGPTSAPKLGDEPLRTWEQLRDETLEALDRAGVLQSTAHEPFGPEFGSVPVNALVGFMAAELAVHVWDMARTAEVDERLDPALVDFSDATWRSLGEEVLRMDGMFGPEVAPAKGADAQTRLLNFLGRTV